METRWLLQLVMLHASSQRNQCKHCDHHHRRQRDCDRRHELCPLGSSTSEPTLPSHYLVCSLQHKSPDANSAEPPLLRLLQRKSYDLSSYPSTPTAGRKLSTTRIVLNGKRAARQQGDPFSMGGSSNGGKAIGTLWCKSMFGSGWCQDTIPANRK